MRNIQIIDGAVNATFSVFQATEKEFAAIFPDERDMELAEDLFERLGDEEANHVLMQVWKRPILKRDALGIHGTLFYNNEYRRERIPQSKREVDWMKVCSTKPRETYSRGIAEIFTSQFVHAA